jgi:hypothetical protein
MSFTVGDRVAWHVRGKTHIGIVVEVVAAQTYPSTYRDSYGVPGARNQEAYIVDEAGRLFYPRVKDLQSA